MLFTVNAELSSGVFEKVTAKIDSFRKAVFALKNSPKKTICNATL